MIYNETYVATVNNVAALIDILTKDVPLFASIELAGSAEHSMSCEVWYDKDTNTVILK